MNVQDMTPVQIDEILMALDMELAKAEADVAAALVDVHYRAGDRPRNTRRTQWEMTHQQAEQAVRDRLASGTMRPWDVDSAERTLTKLEIRRGTVREIEARMRPFDDEYNRRPWQRFYVVAGGHIHSNYHCQTLHREGKRTRLGWMPNLSGHTMASAIAHFEAEGSGRSAVLCSVCMPDAPVALFAKPVDDSLCPGSGTSNYDRERSRLGYYTGNYGHCNHCGQRITVPSNSRNMRKHRPAG